MNHTTRFALAAALAPLVAFNAPAQTPTLAEVTELAPSVMVEPSYGAPAPAETPHQLQMAGPVMARPVMSAPAIECCPIEVVDVRTKLSARRFLRCAGPQINLTACVDNPADCCGKLYAVPLCVPACCVGEPRPCNARRGLLGRGHVDLAWDCGLVAKVTFLKHGGVIITYAAG